MSTANELVTVSAGGERCELVEGELIKIAPSGGLHGRVANNCAFVLTSFVGPTGLGVVFAAETGFLLARDPDTVRAPDAAFVSAGRLPRGETTSAFLELTPDLVVEVISPSDAASSVEMKIEGWLKAGTQLVWVVYPQSRSVVVYRASGDARVLSDADTLDGAPVFEGLAVPVGDLFR